MPGGSGIPAVGALRAYVAARVAADGLRRTAHAIGLRPSGLRYFLEGGEPRQATRRKLENWYLSVAATHPDRSDVEAEMLALRVLVRDLPASVRSEGLNRSLHFYRDLYDSLGTPRPPWLRAPGQNS
jgi:hypothetical protein